VDLTDLFTAMTAQCPLTAYTIASDSPMRGATIPDPASPSLVIDASGSGVYNFTIDATSAAGNKASKAFRLTVSGAVEYL